MDTYYVQHDQLVHLVDAEGATLCILSPEDDTLLGKTIYTQLSFAKMKKTEIIAAARWDAVNKDGLLFEGVRFHTDADARIAVLEALTGLKERGILPAAWKGIDGILPLTPELFMGLAVAILELKQTMFTKEFALVAQIEQCTAIEEVEAITWDTAPNE